MSSKRYALLALAGHELAYAPHALLCVTKGIQSATKRATKPSFVSPLYALCLQVLVVYACLHSEAVYAIRAAKLVINFQLLTLLTSLEST